MRAIAANTAVRLLAILSQPFPSQAQACGRECLAGILTSYLDSVLDHDPTADDVRFTEDTVELEHGRGLWATAGSGWD